MENFGFIVSKMDILKLITPLPKLCGLCGADKFRCFQKGGDLFQIALNQYALLQYNDENHDTIAIQTYGGEGLLWSSAGEAQQYTYASYLTNTANGPLLTAHRDNSDSSNLSDVLDMEGNLLLRRLGSCYSIDDLPDDCFIARQGFDYGLMDSTGQWLYRESIFSSPSDDAGGGYLY